MTAAHRGTDLQRSRYLLIGPQRYLDDRGDMVRLAYATRTATVLCLRASTADSIADGRLGDLPADELTALVRAEALVPQGEDELAKVLGRVTATSARMSARQITIMPTAYCNMACAYCGQEHHKAPVDSGRLQQLRQRVENVMADPAVTAVRVSWFGGEPLLALRVIRELSERFVAAAAGNQVRYTASMATNGSLLTRRNLETLYDDCRLRSVDITIDGPAPVHDARRVKKNGTGSFRQLTGVLAEAVRERRVPDLQVTIRTNVDIGNQDAVPDLYYDLACLGFGAPQVRVSLMPVHSWGNDVSAVELEAGRYAAREAEWLRLACRLGLNVSFLPSAVKATTCLATSRSGELLDSAGRVYSCSEHPLVPQVAQSQVVARLEDLDGSHPRPAGRFDDWYSSVEAGRFPCHACPMLPVCGGSCPKLWRDGYIPCPSFKHNWRERLGMVAGERGYRAVTEAGVE